jgi:hypothetical protein
MVKGWSFRKTKHDHEAGSLRDGNKKVRGRHYDPVDYAHQLYKENQPTPMWDMSLPAGWLLNSRRVQVPPVSHEGRERRDETHRQI